VFNLDGTFGNRK